MVNANLKVVFCWGIIILCTAIAAFYSVPVIITYIVDLWNYDYRDKMPCVWKHDDVPVREIALPQCLLAWRNATISKVRQDTKSYSDQFNQSCKGRNAVVLAIFNLKCVRKFSSNYC